MVFKEEMSFVGVLSSAVVLSAVSIGEIGDCRSVGLAEAAAHPLHTLEFSRRRLKLSTQSFRYRHPPTRPRALIRFESEDFATSGQV